MNDSEIIELYFQRDEQAIKETDSRYGGLCHHIAYNILNNKEDAEECVSDAYVGSEQERILHLRIHRALPNLVNLLPRIRNLHTNTPLKPTPLP